MNLSDPEAVLVKIEEAWGSVPREVGATMVVRAESIEGTIGGGALEWRAMAHARELLAGVDGPWSMDLPLGPTLAQCCGGRVRLSFEPYRYARRIEAVQNRLHLYGFGHVGQAVFKAMQPLSFDIQVYDERRSVFQPHNLDPQASHDHYQSISAAGDFHLVMTHSHQIDLAIVGRLIRLDDFGYLGLIGSATKRARFERALRAEGISDARLKRLICPVGIAGIKDKAPPAIAASVAAQLLMVSEALAAIGRNKQLVTPPE